MRFPLAINIITKYGAALAVVGLVACAGTPKRATRIDTSVQLQGLKAGGDTFPAAGKGKVVVIDLWATWCKACRKELPKLQRLHDAEAGSQLLVVAINVGEDANTAATYARGLGLSLPIYLDPEHKFANSVGAKQFPSIYVLDRDGAIISKARTLTPAVLSLVRRRVAERGASR